MKAIFRCFLLLSIGALAARAQFETLLVPPAEPVQAGETMEVTLYLNNPSTVAASFRFPAMMAASIASAKEQRTVPARPTDIATDAVIELLPMSFTRTRVSIPIPDTMSGNVSVRLVDPRTNPIMLAVVPAAVVKLSPAARRIGSPLPSADSASVIFDALQAAKSRGMDVLIADTAGRLHT